MTSATERSAVWERGRALLEEQATGIRRTEGLAQSSDAVWGRTHVAIIGRNRDSDTLAESNYAIVAGQLLEDHGETISVHDADCPGDDAHPREGWCECAPDVVEERYRHWAVGWVEELVVRVERPGIRGASPVELHHEPTDALVDALEWVDALANYPVADEDDFSARELEEMTDYVAGEVGDDVDGPWTDAVLSGILQVSSSPDDVSYAELQERMSLAYAERAEPLLTRYRAWQELRLVGDGQLTIYGEEIRVPAPPELEELEYLEELQLPGGIAGTVEDSDTYADIVDALEELRALALPA